MEPQESQATRCPPPPSVTDRDKVGTASSVSLYYIELIHRLHGARSSLIVSYLSLLGTRALLYARVATTVPILRCANPEGVGRIRTSDTEH